MLEHYSGHVVVTNSLAMKMTGIEDASTAPDGGVYDRYANGSLTGVFKENAIFPIKANFELSISELRDDQILRTANLYLSSGVTTAQDTFFSMDEPEVFKGLGDVFPIDLNGYTFLPNNADLTKFHETVKNYGTAWMKVRGVKFILDGSIQAYTGLLSRPYWVPKENQYDNLDNYTYNSSRSCATEDCGEDSFTNRTLLRELFKILHDEDFDILAHCNGDGSVDIFNEAVRFVRDSSEVKSNTRFVIIHAQTIREGQLDVVAELGIMISFFSPHIYFWGEDHFHIFLGPARANRMNPAKSAVKRSINFTLHNDSPVVIMGETTGRNNYIEIMEAAINRVTNAGRVLGEEQKLTPYEALKAVTVHGAWQAREENVKGSITVGKMADFVVLSDNPLKENTTNFKDLKVVATVKAGKLVFG